MLAKVLALAEEIKSAVLQAVIATAVAWGAKEYNALAAQYPQVVAGLAVFAAALWNKYRR